ARRRRSRRHDPATQPGPPRRGRRQRTGSRTVSVPASVPNPRTELLVACLREHAGGLLADTAAVDLLARHHTWLPRTDFRRPIPIGRCPTTDTPLAYIRWRAALTALTSGQLPCSSGEAD